MSSGDVDWREKLDAKSGEREGMQERYGDQVTCCQSSGRWDWRGLGYVYEIGNGQTRQTRH